MGSILELKNVSKTFEYEGDSVEALKNVCFQVEESTFNVIIGPSGCGKSTLLRIIANLVRPTKGQVVWFQKPLVSFVFQNFALFPFLTVWENIEFGLKMKKISNHKRKQIVSNLLEEVGLKGFENKHPKELSGGMKQRVGIARALSVNPTLLLMDEPFSSLDEFTAENLRRLLLRLCLSRKITVLMVTHFISEAVELSDKILVMSQRPGTMIEVINNQLARPRKIRSTEFYKLEDKVKSLVKIN